MVLERFKWCVWTDLRSTVSPSISNLVAYLLCAAFIFSNALISPSEAFASEYSICAASKKPLECYADFIINNSGDESAINALNEAVGQIEVVEDEKSKISLASDLVQKIGKHYLPYFPPYFRFYLSGPNHLEIYRLIEMKRLGISDNDLLNITMNAKGSYEKIGPKGIRALKRSGFSGLQIGILVNYSFLKQGGKVTINDLRMLIGSNASEKEKYEMIAFSNIKDVKIDKGRGDLLSNLGFSKEQIKVLKYNQLLRDGPNNYPLWKIIQDHKDKVADGKIVRKISATDFFYKDFNEYEIEVIKSFGISSTVVQAMRNRTKLFFASVADSTKAAEMKSNAENITYNRTYKYVQNYQRGNDLFKGVSYSQPENKQKGASDVAGDCVLLKGALKACEHVPFPLGYACSALARNKFDCPIPM